MKIIDKTNLNDKQLKNITNEIQIMKTLNQPNILKLYQYYNYANFCYLVLEHCDGGEIFNKIIEYTYFSEDLSRHVFKQLLDAIKYLHENNIVHRDIKPENLFFKKIKMMPRSSDEFKASLRSSDDDSKIDEGIFVPGVGGGTIGVIKLGDFGLAKTLKKVTSKSNEPHLNLKTPCGTAGYTAPEVITCNTDDDSINKQNYYDMSVDIWSLGCFLYTILCGFPPFYDDDNKLTMKILNGDYTFLRPWWDEISHEAKDLISKMLVINPNDRITVDLIYNHPWVKGLKFSDDYFNINSKYENDQFEHVENVEHVETKKDINDVSHILHRENVSDASLSDDSSIDSNDPIARPSQPSPFQEKFLDIPRPVKGEAPLLSPRANAIKSVFNNPAMNELSNLKFNNGNIFDIEEEKKDVLTNLNKLTIRSSNESSDELDDNEQDYQTRQSSIVSNGEKFNLNMNDSNIILRRKSTIQRHSNGDNSVTTDGVAKDGVANEITGDTR